MNKISNLVSELSLAIDHGHDFSQAIEYMVANGVSHISVGSKLESTRKSLGATNYWRSLIDYFPNDRTVFYRYCRSLIRVGSKNMALEIVDKYNGEKSFEKKLLNAEVLFDLKEYSNSELIYESLLSDFPSETDVLISYVSKLVSIKLYGKAWALIKRMESMDFNDSQTLIFDDVKKVYDHFCALENVDYLGSDVNFGSLALKHSILYFKNRVILNKNKPILGNVAFITGSLGPGGAERQIARTAVQLKELQGRTNHVNGTDITGNVSVVVKSHGNEKNNDFFLPSLVASDVKTCELNNRKEIKVHESISDIPVLQDIVKVLPSSAVYGIKRLTPYLIEESIDTAFIWQDGAVIFAALAALIAGTQKIVLNFRGLPPNIRSHMNRPEYEDLYKALSHIPGVEFVSNSNAAAIEYAKWIGIDASRIKVIYNGVDVYDVDDVVESDYSLYEDFIRRTPSATKTFGGIFRFVLDKRPLLAIKFINHYLSKSNDARFILVGDGQLFEKSKKLAIKLGVDDRILFVGKSTKVKYWLSKFDVLFLFSAFEGLPNVLIESQLLGVPVLTTPAGGAEECFLKGVTGFSFSDLENPNFDEGVDYINSLHTLFKNNIAQREIAISYAKRNFSVEGMVSNTISALAFNDE